MSKAWLERHLDAPFLSMGSESLARVGVGINQTVEIAKEYGPLAGGDVRVRLEWLDDGDPEWIVEYSGLESDEWVEKVRWACQ